MRILLTAILMTTAWAGPFEGQVAELIVKHVTAKVPPLPSLVPDCPAALSRIIYRPEDKSRRYACLDPLL